ncbi:hypothetical protein M3Y94_00796800 [Aphelenchoides besseyi]|nr:hypothetical protein M3Y94_00796800 [Aphelenchoides besseyi]
MLFVGDIVIQIAHLVLISELSTNEQTRSSMYFYRTTFGFVANIAVFISLFCLLRTHEDNQVVNPKDLRYFQEVAIGVCVVGILISFVFCLLVKEPKRLEADRRCSITSKMSNIVEMSWRSWFTQYNFYLVFELTTIALIYMLCRLYSNLSQVYFPMYVTTRKMSKSNVAALPMISYLSSFAVSCIMGRTWVDKRLNRKLLYGVGAFLAVNTSILFYFTIDSLTIYAIAFLIGTTQSILLISSLSITSRLINHNTEIGAFVYGTMSFLDKLANGIAVQLIELISPSCTRLFPVLPASTDFCAFDLRCFGLPVDFVCQFG